MEMETRRPLLFLSMVSTHSFQANMLALGDFSCTVFAILLQLATNIALPSLVEDSRPECAWVGGYVGRQAGIPFNHSSINNFIRAELNQ